MKFEKRQLAVADMGYAVSTQQILGENRVIAASESTGPAVVFAGDEMKPCVISTGPGGCMGFAPVPGRDDSLFMITRFYPIFKSEKAGIEIITAENGLDEPWAGRRIIDLPFVHRIASVSTVLGNYLIGATVCESKEFQDDWSRAGAVYAFSIDEQGAVDTEPIIILDSIHRNHGMGLGQFRGVESLLIAGDEGVLALSLPGETGADGNTLDAWSMTTVLDHPVSEIALFDFDYDGVDEMATIEPFHGDQMSVYKDSDGAWNRIYADEIAFGHGLSAGSLGGTPAIVLGNRAGTKDLVCYHTTGNDPFDMQKTVIDRGSGTAGATMIKTSAGDAVITSNAEYSEYALYLAKS
jgi:hypothetical protein